MIRNCPFAQPPPIGRLLLSAVLGWLLGCAGAPGPSVAPSTASAARPSHLQIVPSDVAPPVFDWTERVDYDGLRHWFGRRADFRPRCVTPSRQAAGEAMLRGDWAEAERLTAPLVAACPVDPSLHLWRYAALTSLGREPEASLHGDWYAGLLASILETGDGASAATAFVTISKEEAFAVLSHFGLTPERERHLAGPPEFDVFDARSDAGIRVSVYFHPAFRALRGANGGAMQ